MSSTIFNLEGRLAVVTGGAGGIGAAVCRQLGSFGAQIMIMDIDQSAIDRTINTLRDEGITISGYKCDSSNESQIMAFYTTVTKNHGTPDILVNNASQGVHIPPQDTPFEDWQRVIGTSLTGYFLNAREFFKVLNLTKKPGSIINISSIAGSSAIGRGNFVYSVAKGGVNQMTKELAVEWAKSNIRVNAIQPCSVNTPGWRAWIETEGEEAKVLMELLISGIPLGRVAEPEDIASAVLFLASDASAMITGVILPVDGGNLAFNAGGTLGNY
jgi:NAD(P)-dependent dehydrogenase (short-subunit alcohol dehydrogenase family)